MSIYLKTSQESFFVPAHSGDVLPLVVQRPRFSPCAVSVLWSTCRFMIKESINIVCFCQIIAVDNGCRLILFYIFCVIFNRCIPLL